MWHVHQPQNNTKAQNLRHIRISRIQRPAARTLLCRESLDSAIQLAIPILLKERQSQSVLPIFNISARPQMTLVMKPEVGSHYFLPKVIMWPCWELKLWVWNTNHCTRHTSHTVRRTSCNTERNTTQPRFCTSHGNKNDICRGNGRNTVTVSAGDD